MVLALVASSEGLTKHALLSSVYGYADRFGDVSQRGALDRQFERDKEQLRGLGIPVDTIESPGEPGNNQLARYRISRDALEVPEGLAFTDRELMLLRMAVLAWREGSLTREARRAAMKLESIGAGVDAPSIGVSAGFGISEHSAPALISAIEDGHGVRFAYQLPQNSAALERWVLPLRLHRFEGRWHLISFDFDRNAPRVFLLSRIVGEVTAQAVDRDLLLGDSFDAPRLVDQAISELEKIQALQRVQVRVRRRSAAEAQLMGRADVRVIDDGLPERSVLEFGTTDVHELAVLIAGFGADAEAVSPAGLRDEVRRLLATLAARHTGSADGRADR